MVAPIDTQATNETNKETVELPTPRMGRDGKAVCDWEFFLVLARCGKDAWNHWREAYDFIAVTFEGLNFEEPQNRDINFSKFQLGDNANFRGCRFGDQADLSGATFGVEANLSGATFGILANLIGAGFEAGANLTGVTFATQVSLYGAIFAA
jgi:hypothetical protein